jgi:hypothetical protein
LPSRFGAFFSRPPLFLLIVVILAREQLLKNEPNPSEIEEFMREAAIMSHVHLHFLFVFLVLPSFIVTNNKNEWCSLTIPMFCHWWVCARRGSRA